MSLFEQLKSRFTTQVTEFHLKNDEITLVVPKEQIVFVSQALRDESVFAFEQLMDLCGVDYSTYGQVEWETGTATATGFSRGVTSLTAEKTQFPARFAVVYHLLSLTHNHRVRLKVFVGEGQKVPSVTSIWNCANWFEREAYDLFGILFEGHPDLRRILTDYGFVGHPLRKDFPLVGKVEARYDYEQKRVIYEPVSITNRVLVPKVIRQNG